MHKIWPLRSLTHLLAACDDVREKKYDRFVQSLYVVVFSIKNPREDEYEKKKRQHSFETRSCARTHFVLNSNDAARFYQFLFALL